MSNPIFQDFRPTRAPQSLKQAVLASCMDALIDPVQTDNLPKTNWIDRCLRSAAVFTVFLFALTCFASFATNGTLIASARFSRLDAKSSKLTGKNGKNGSFLVMRRGQSWP